MTTKTLPERIADDLRRDILRGSLEPGALIKERDQAALKAVSRTPMREAIRILVNEGLVVLRPSRSPIVANPSFAEVTAGIEVLLALEELAAELVCQRASDDEIRTLRAMHQRMMREADEIDSLDLFEIDMTFHKTLVRAAHNPALSESHTAFIARMWRVRYLSASQRNKRSSTFQEHEGIVSGLEARDVQKARTFVRQHLTSLLANIRHKLDPADGTAPGAPPDPHTA